MQEKLLKFAKLAGKIQLKERHKKNLQINYKDNNLYSIVSKTDLKISELFHEFIKKEFKDLNYFIIDEESIDIANHDFYKNIKNSEYLFVIDPLDGTLQYSQNIPIFGISIGVFKNKKPYLGILYMPALKDLVYSTENKEAYWIKNAFTLRSHKIALHKSFKTKSSLIIDLQQHFELDNTKNTKGYLFVDYLCSTFSYILIATSRIRSGMFKDWLWDKAGAWAIFDAIGYKIYDFTSQKYINKLDLKDFTLDLKFKNAHIVGPKEEIDYLKNIIVRDLNK